MHVHRTVVKPPTRVCVLFIWPYNIKKRRPKTVDRNMYRINCIKPLPLWKTLLNVNLREIKKETTAIQSWIILRSHNLLDTEVICIKNQYYQVISIWMDRDSSNSINSLNIIGANGKAPAQAYQGQTSNWHKLRKR